MRILFLLSDFTQNFCVGVFFSSIKWDITEIDDVGRSCSLYTMYASSLLVSSNTLTQAPEFIGLGLVPIFIFQVFVELTVFESLP